jgi:hypothetical protein
MTRALAWLAVVLSVGTVVAYVALVQKAMIVIPAAGYLGALAVAVILALGAVVRGRRVVTISALVVTVVLLALGAVFNHMLRVPAGPTAFIVGRPAPDFMLPDSEGKPASLAEYRGRKPVVLVFYRGHW